MKKIIAIIISIVFSVIFFSCARGSSGAAELVAIESMFKDVVTQAEKWVYPSDQVGVEADATAELAAGTYKVGVCIYTFEDTFMTFYYNEIADYFKSLETDDVKFEVTIADGKNDMAVQLSQVDDFIADGVDVLIVNLVLAAGGKDVTEKARDADIPLVYINREPASTDMQALDYEGRVCYVGADARQSGTIQGQIVVDLPDSGDIDGDGVVRYITLVGDAENVDAQYRTIFSIKALDDAGIISMRLFEQRGDWVRANGKELTSTALSQFGDAIDVIFANNDDMALGAIEACKEAGKVIGTDVYIVGVDATTLALDALAAGDLTGTVLNDHVNQSHTAIDVAILAISGYDLKDYYMVDYLAVV